MSSHPASSSPSPSKSPQKSPARSPTKKSSKSPAKSPAKSPSKSNSSKSSPPVESPESSDDGEGDESDAHEEGFPVEILLERKWNAKEKDYFYLVKWEGYESEDNTWEPKGNLSSSLRHDFDMDISEGLREPKTGRLLLEKKENSKEGETETEDNEEGEGEGKEFAENSAIDLTDEHPPPKKGRKPKKGKSPAKNPPKNKKSAKTAKSADEEEGKDDGESTESEGPKDSSPLSLLSASAEIFEKGEGTAMSDEGDDGEDGEDGEVKEIQKSPKKGNSSKRKSVETENSEETSTGGKSLKMTESSESSSRRRVSNAKIPFDPQLEDDIQWAIRESKMDGKPRKSRIFNGSQNSTEDKGEDDDESTEDEDDGEENQKGERCPKNPVSNKKAKAKRRGKKKGRKSKTEDAEGKVKEGKEGSAKKRGRKPKDDAMVDEMDFAVMEISDDDTAPAYVVEKVKGRRFVGVNSSPGKTNSEAKQMDDGTTFYDDVDFGVSGYEYLIKWEGYPDDQNTWEPSENTTCQDKIEEFHRKAAPKLAVEINNLVSNASMEEGKISVAKAARRINELGVCHFSEGLDSQEVSHCYNSVINTLNVILWNIRHRSLEDDLRTRGFLEFKTRDEGRYDMMINPDAVPSIVNPNAPWIPVVKSVLGEEAELRKVGCMLSMPGSVPQSWHSDGPHVYSECHVPAHALVVFIPLVNLTRENGPTEFSPSSHVQFDSECQSNTWAPMASAGQCVIFDFRLLHRGLGNISDSVRPLLYLQYEKPWFKDVPNFSDTRYKELPSLLSVESRDERMNRRKGETEGEGEGEKAAEGTNEKGDSTEKGKETADDTEKEDDEEGEGEAEGEGEGEGDKVKVKGKGKGRGRPKGKNISKESSSSSAFSSKDTILLPTIGISGRVETAKKGGRERPSKSKKSSEGEEGEGEGEGKPDETPETEENVPLVPTTPLESPDPSPATQAFTDSNEDNEGNEENGEEGEGKEKEKKKDNEDGEGQQEDEKKRTENKLTRRKTNKHHKEKEKEKEKHKEREREREKERRKQREKKGERETRSKHPEFL